MSNGQPMTEPTPAAARKPRPLLDMMVSIVLPALILMKLSGAAELGATRALLLALAFPLGLGLYELVRYRKTNFIAVLGLVSVLLTGGIGLLRLDAQWLAVKEAAVPGLIGIAVLVSTRTRYPLIRTILFNPNIMRVTDIRQKLAEHGHEPLFEARLLRATYLLSATFFFSSAMNYFLAKWIVTSPAGSTAFNEELGQLTLISYPVIAVPSMIMMMAILYYLWRTIHGLTGLSLEEILVTPEARHSRS